MSKFKSLFLKIAMATIVCLVASFSFVIVNFKNANKNQTLNLTANEPVVNVSTDNGISLNWRKDVTPQTEQITDTYGNSNKNVQALGDNFDKTSNSGNSKYYTVTGFENLDIVGGTTITYDYTPSALDYDTYNLSATVSFGGNSSGSATFTTKGGYAIVGFMFGNTNNGGESVNWKYYTLVQNTNTNEIKNGSIAGSSEIPSPFTPEDIDPSYNGTLVFKAIVIEIPYTIDLYYEGVNEDGTGTGEINSKLTASSYSISNSLPLDGCRPTNIPKNKVFGYWMFNEENANSAGYAIDIQKMNGDSPSFTVSKKEGNVEVVKITFTGANFNKYHSNTEGKRLIYFTGVKGYGQLDQSSAQIITAKWSNTYELTIDNKSNIWDSMNVEKQQFYGVYSSEDKSLDTFNNSSKLEISHSTNNLRFMSSERNVSGVSAENIEGLSFYKEDKFRENKNNEYRAYSNDNLWYYVYNYGHYIAGWKLYYDGTNYTHYLQYTNSQWQILNDQEQTIDIKNLTDITTANLAEYAEQVDEQLGLGLNIPGLTMEPVWAPVSIGIYNGVTTKTTTYASTAIYSIPNLTAPLGQTLYCYQYIEGDDNALISTKGLWNYKNIPYNTSTDANKTNGYVYSAGSTIGAGTYTLNVTAVYLDNIYKVMLTGAKTNTDNTYKLVYENDNFNIDKDFQFNYNAGNDSNLNKIITFENCPFFEYKEWSASSYPLIEDYTKELKGWIKTYRDGIDGNDTNDFDIFRKVYTYDKGKKTDESNNYYDKCKCDGRMWIYLANNQPTGNLPVFETSYQELIFWKNQDSTKDKDGTNLDSATGFPTANAEHYAYPTHAYNSTYHSEDLNKFTTHKVKNNNGQDTDTILNIWKFSDGYVSGNNISTLNAHYFRKNHILDIHTIVDSVGDDGKYGYVKVDIDDKTADDDKNGKYIVIYNGSKMTVYKLSDSVQNLSTYSITNGLGTEIEGDFIYYEGCDITIMVVDQSKDTNAMKSGSYDDMIGFKFNTITQNTLINFLNSDSNNDPYIYALNAQAISDLKYTNGSTIDLDVKYEPIQYTFTIKIDDPYAGEINVDNNGVIDKANKEFTLSNVNVLGENKYNIFAWMFAGYTLQDNNAFTLSNGSTLKTYDDSIENTQENQNYSIKAGKGYFYGDWLREYFYNTREDYSITDVNETLTINTKPIVFNYGLKIYNSYNNTSGEMEDDTVEDVTISLTNGVAYTNTVGSHLTNTTAGYIYRLGEGVNAVDYALLSSRLYLPRNPLTTSNNGYRTYDFILNKQPTYSYTINKDLIPSLVENYKGNGLIISPKNNNRTIYLMLEVRELLKITVNTENTFNDKNVSIDTNSTTRTATIENGTNNSKDLKLNSGSDFTETATIYSYKGLNNFVNFKYDQKRYKGVYTFGEGSEKYLETGGLEFESTGSATLTVRFDPKPLTVEMKYIDKDGNVVARSGMNDYIAEETLPTIPGEYYISDYVYYSVKAGHNDYDLELIINEQPIGSTFEDPTNRIVSANYGVLDKDYNFEKIEILVKVIEKNNSVLNIRYLLQDSSKVVVGDVYGNITVKDNYGSLGSMEDMAISNVLSFTAFEGREIKVEIALQEGYCVAGYKHNAYDIIQTTENSFTLIEEFNPNTDYGNYYIVIDKELVNVKLDVEDKIGNYTINGQTKLTNMYVGLKIDLGYEEFSYSAEKGEKFAYFYYLDKENNKIPLFKLKADGTFELDDHENKIPLNSINITSELLSKISADPGDGTTIKLGVETTDMFKLDYVIEGEEYAETINVLFDDSEYISGTYVDAGKSVSLKIETKAPGKYNIKVTNNKTGEIENKDSLDVTYVFDKNWDIKIEIYPKPFGVTIDENVYKTLAQIKPLDKLQNATPEDVDPANHVNGLQRSGINYNENATMSIVRVTTDRELAEIFITDEKGSFIIVLNGTSYKAYNVKDGKIEDINEDGKIDDNDAINLSEREYSYQITISGNRINIYYITKCDLTVTVNYKLYKEITTA